MTFGTEEVISLIDFPNAKSPTGVISSSTSLLGDAILIVASTVSGTTSKSTGCPLES